MGLCVVNFSDHALSAPSFIHHTQAYKSSEEAVLLTALLGIKGQLWQTTKGEATINQQQQQWCLGYHAVEDRRRPLSQ